MGKGSTVRYSTVQYFKYLTLSLVLCLCAESSDIKSDVSTDAAFMLAIAVCIAARGLLVSRLQNTIGLVARPVMGRTCTPVCSVSKNELEPGEDLWSIVGVPPGSSRSEIRAAYRKRARVVHPDVNSDVDAPRQFRRLVLAFEMLMDDQKRTAWEGNRIRQNAAQRARKAWDDIERAAATSGWGRGAASASERPAGSRREAEERERFQSNQRRRRWRERLLMEIFREHSKLQRIEHPPLRA